MSAALHHWEVSISTATAGPGFRSFRQVVPCMGAHHWQVCVRLPWTRTAVSVEAIRRVATT